MAESTFSVAKNAPNDINKKRNNTRFLKILRPGFEEMALKRYGGKWIEHLLSKPKRKPLKP